MIMLVVPFAAMGAFHFSANMAPDPGSMEWEQARQHCSNLGMNLAIIRSDAEKEIFDLQAPINSNSAGVTYRPHLWLGASTAADDPSDEATWKWVDGSSVSSGFADWHPGKPSSGTQGSHANWKCMEIYDLHGDEMDEYLWGNVPCESLVTSSSPPPLTTSSHHLLCPRR